MSKFRRRLQNEFADPEYRHAYVDDFLDASIATQIKVLREQRQLTQDQLAGLTQMKQSRISALEDVNYSSWSINTLRRLARAFDVALTVKFESFGGKLWDIEFFSRPSLEVPPFDDDAELHASTTSAELRTSSTVRVATDASDTVTTEPIIKPAATSVAPQPMFGASALDERFETEQSAHTYYPGRRGVYNG